MLLLDKVSKWSSKQKQKVPQHRYLSTTTFKAKTIRHICHKVGSLSTQQGGQHREDGTALQLAKRRYKREWVKFAKPCREREDNSRRNPIAKVSHINRPCEPQNKCITCKLKMIQKFHLVIYNLESPQNNNILSPTKLQ